MLVQHRVQPANSLAKQPLELLKANIDGKVCHILQGAQQQGIYTASFAWISSVQFCLTVEGQHIYSDDPCAKKGMPLP